MLTPLALRLGVALGIGLLIGAERERRKGEGPHRGTAGIRTFAIGAALGAVSLELGGAILLGVLVAAVTGMVILAYLRTRQRDPGMTTEAALLLTVLLGALAMREPALASGVAVVTATLLAARIRLHRFVRSIVTERELYDALIFAASVIVVLPLMPNGYLGPFAAVNPRTIWKIVVLMMSVSAAGHIAMRVLGARFGLALAGLASGFASSTATIAVMGARAKEQSTLARAATAGAVLSSVATIVELAIVLQATNRSILWIIRFPLIVACFVTIGYGVIFTFRALKHQPDVAAPPGSAFDLRVTLLLAATVTVVTFASAALNAWLGARGVLVATAIAGFADAHSAAVSAASLAASGKLSSQQAVVPILAGLTTNSLTKAVVTLMAGSTRFSAGVLPGLAVMLGSLWAAFLL